MDVLLYCLFLRAFMPAVCLSLGRVPGDVITGKTSHLPLTTNIKPGISSPPQTPAAILEKRLKPLTKRSALKHNILKIPKPIKLPHLPKLPFLPLLPILPPIPKLPLLPLPLLPIIPPLPLLPPILPSFSKLLKPLRVPIISPVRSQKVLKSKLKPSSLSAQSVKRRRNILKNLLNLRKKGTLSAEKFLRLKKVLLNK